MRDDDAVEQDAMGDDDAVGDTASAPAARARRPVGLAEGTELIGQYAGSGYREPPRLVARGDGQIVRLPELLYLVVDALAATTSSATTRRTTAAQLDQLADAVTQSCGRDISAEQIAYLLDAKLAPLGVSTFADGRQPPQAKANPFLSLRVRFPLLPPKLTWAISSPLRALYLPPILVALIVASLLGDVWALSSGGIPDALALTLLRPSGILTVLGFAIASTFFHELGHAAACRYSGARPGAIGCGLYLVWPAFYTDITNTYRLGRAGRLRTDLGGVYFNGIFIVGLAVGYAETGYPPLLVALLATNLEIVQQLLPTLRFDGYYIAADLIGVPDLFRYIGPILRRTFLRRPPDARLAVLKPWPQRMLAGWVLLVGPALVAQLLYLGVQAPRLLRVDVSTMSALSRRAASSSGSPVSAWLSAGTQMVLLALPLAGLLLIVLQLARAFGRAPLRYDISRHPRCYGLPAGARLI
jgi:putative peptide zinc metalloprotease protein